MEHLKSYGGWALITGASSGIGREFARMLAANGINCILVARRGDRLRELANELNVRHGVHTQCVELDLTQEGAVDQLVQATQGEIVGILVNNAGVGYAGPFETRDRKRMDELITLNCRVPVALTHAYLPAMLERRKGAVIMVASLLAFLPAPYDSVYSGTKAFDLYFGESLWAELLGTGVDVITVCPSTTRTEFFETEGRSETESASIVRHADSPELIARITLKNLGKRPTVAPVSSFSVAMLTRILPRKWVARIMRIAMRRRLNAHQVQ